MRDARHGILNRTVTQQECCWLKHDYEQGTKVTEYLDCTYGCIDTGIAITFESEKCFREIPYDAIQWLE